MDTSTTTPTAKERIDAWRRQIATVLYEKRLYREGEVVKPLCGWWRLAEIVGLASPGSLQDTYSGDREPRAETWAGWEAAVGAWIKAQNKDGV